MKKIHVKYGIKVLKNAKTQRLSALYRF